MHFYAFESAIQHADFLVPTGLTMNDGHGVDPIKLVANFPP
jgi:hypothetical protein